MGLLSARIGRRWSGGSQGSGGAGSSLEGPHGVSLKFLHAFIAEHNIDAHMSTADVVHTIIKPLTRDSGKSYVETFLLDKPNLGAFSGLVKGHRRPCLSSKLHRKHPQFKKPNLFEFVTHAWSTPFVSTVEALGRYVVEANVAEYATFTLIPFVEDFLDTPNMPQAFFWVDVFCHNHHEPPNPEESREAMGAAGSVLIALCPAAQAVVLGRAWCLFEIYSGISMPDVDVKMSNAFTKGFVAEHVKGGSCSAEELSSKLAEVGVLVKMEDALTTVAGDKALLVEAIEEAGGVDEVDKVVSSAITKSMVNYHNFVLDAKRGPGSSA